MKGLVLLAAWTCAVWAAAAQPSGSIRVRPGDSIEDAIKSARVSGGSTNEIVFAPGCHYLSATLVLDARDSGLALRAEKPGKTILYGGRKLSGWRPDGDGLWAVDLPEVRDGRLDFRVLVVEGRFAERAVWPGGTNRLENLGKWNVRLLPAVAGYWERPPTDAELRTMPYRPGDLPPGFDVKNAEVRCYHMWSESLLRVASNDVERSILYFAEPAKWPAGACGRRQYMVYNIREGLTEPGQWYLDRTAGKVVYRPRKGEDMARIEAVAPLLDTVIKVDGKRKAVTNLTVSGLSIQATTPSGRPQFGAAGMSAAIFGTGLSGCTLESLDVRNVGGIGIVIRDSVSTKIVDTVCADTGACGATFGGRDCEMSGCRIVGTGRLYPSACGVAFGGRNLRFIRNEISDIPYSGVIMGGSGHLVEDNLVCRVMRVMHDGAAFYGNISRCTLRGNVVRDVVEQGRGFGASAYYVDEGGEDNIVERNLAVDVPMPVHNHVTRNVRVVDNTFIARGDIMISFARSTGGVFSRNKLVVGGRVRTNFPNGLVEFEDNKVFRPRNPRNPADGTVIETWRLENPQMRPREPLDAIAITNGPAPVLDGEFKPGEWPGIWSPVERDATRRILGGAPAYVRAACDGTNLYVVVQVASFHSARFSKGHAWGRDDGVRVELGAYSFDGFIDGAVTCSDAALGARISSYAGFARRSRGMGRQQLYAFAVPLDALSTASGQGDLPFNVRVFVSEHGETRFFEAPADGGAPARRLRLPKDFSPKPRP